MYDMLVECDSETLVRRSFCVFLAFSLLCTSRTRSDFFTMRCQYIELLGVDRIRHEVGKFFTNTLVEVATPCLPVSLVPFVGGWPVLGRDVYRRVVRSGALEVLLIVTAALPPGPIAAAGLCCALVMFTSLFGQRMVQMLGLVSGAKDLLMVWSLTLLTCQELGGGGAVQAMQVVLSAAYFVPGITKLIFPKRQGFGWFSWLDGRSLQVVLLERCVLFDNPLAKHIALLPWICRFGCLATVVFECAWLALPVFPDTLGLPLGVIGLTFHLGCVMMLGINFIPFWTPSYACLIPSAQTYVRWYMEGSVGVGTPSNMGHLCAGVLMVFFAGLAWYYVEMTRTGSIPESKSWPLGVPPYYSGYCSGYPPDKNDTITICAVVLYVTRRNASEQAWRPKIDAYFARRINAECRMHGLETARRANLILLALSEMPDSRPSRGDKAEAARVATFVGRQFSKVRWVEKTFVLAGSHVKEQNEEKFRLEGDSVRTEVEAAFLKD